MDSFLRRPKAFALVDVSDWNELTATCSGVVEVDADTDLVREGARPDRLHVVLEGWACRYLLVRDGRRQIPALVLPGDVADLDALGCERLEFSVSTLTPCRVARLSRSALQSAIDRTPGLARAFLALAIQENGVLIRRTVSLGRRTAREQVAHFLCELVTRLNWDADPAAYVKRILPLTQAELADVLGLSTVHVNRVLQRLRADGLARLAGERLEIVDWTGLAAVGEFRMGSSQSPAKGVAAQIQSGAQAKSKAADAGEYLSEGNGLDRRPPDGEGSGAHQALRDMSR